MTRVLAVGRNETAFASLHIVNLARAHSDNRRVYPAYKIVYRWWNSSSSDRHVTSLLAMTDTGVVISAA